MPVAALMSLAGGLPRTARGRGSARLRALTSAALARGGEDGRILAMRACGSPTARAALRLASRLLGPALALALALAAQPAQAAGVASAGSPLDAGRSSAAAFPALCGNAGPAPAVQHVIVVMMENHSYSQVVGSASAPYQTSLAKHCAVATEAFGATHASSANYLAVSAGEYPVASEVGCKTVTRCADASTSLYQQLDAAGLTWKAYEEGMPSQCDTSNDASTYYKIGHNPPIFYSGISANECAAKDVGVASLDSNSGPFYNNLQAGKLPSFSWVTPNMADNGENPCGGGCALQAADTWLGKFVPIVQASPEYQSGNTLLLITYDEGHGKDYTVGENCTNMTADLGGMKPSCHIPLFVIYPYVKAGAKNATFFDHYSVTRTVEDIFGLPYLAHAADTKTASLVGRFGIP